MSIFQNFWGIYTEKSSCLQHTKCQSILIYNLLFNLTQKTNHLKLIAMLITFNLIDLFFKTIHVFKSKSIKFDKWPLNAGITKCFLIDKQVFLTCKVQSAFPRGAASHGSPWDNSFYLNTWLFLLGNWTSSLPSITLSCQWVVPIHVLNSCSLSVLPCIVVHCELIPYCCWNQLFLP